VCSSLLALGGAAGALASQTAARRTSAPASKVISPENGRRLPAGPVLIKLQVGGVGAVGVRLNGRPIASWFLLAPGRVPCLLAIKSPHSSGGICRLEVTPNYGLRYGLNVLRVWFGVGRGARVRTVRFRVATGRPLAAAGRDPASFVQIDRRFVLNGRASLISPGLRQRLARQGRRARVSYRWRVIGCPRGGQGVAPDDGPGRYDPYRNARGELAGANTATPSVELDREGVYRMRLTVTQPDGRTGRDDVTLVAGGEGGGTVTDPPIDAAPLVGVDTMASENGQQGVEIHTYRNIPLPGCPMVVRSAIGSSCFYANPDGNPQSAQLVVLSRTDLSLAANRSFDCRDPQACVVDFARYSTTFNGSSLLIAENVPIQGKRYSLITVPGYKQGFILAEGAVSAHLSVNNVARYSPYRPPSESDASVSPVIKLLTQDPQPWPSASGPQQLALARLGSEVGLGPDPRAGFYSQNRDWSLVQTQIDGARFDTLAPPPSPQEFTPADYDWAKQELRTEIDYVRAVNKYFQNLAAPYDGASKTLWSDFQKSVSDIVNTETSNATGAKIFAGAKEVVGAILDLIPGGGAAFKWSESAVLAAEVVATTYHTAVGLAELGGEPADTEFSVESANLGKELSDRLDQTEKEISTRWRNIVVADYGKLRTVALCSQSLPACDDPDKAWASSSDINEQTNMETLLKLGLQREIFTKLVPAKYPLALALTPVSQADRDITSTAAHWCPPVPPFENTTGLYLLPHVDSEYWRVKQSINVPGNGLTPLVLTTGDPGFGGTWKAASWTVVGRMFDGLDPGGDFGKGGLAIDENKFMQDAYGVVSTDAWSGSLATRGGTWPTPQFRPYDQYPLTIGCRGYAWSGQRPG
jgi:hypothetical protein